MKLKVKIAGPKVHDVGYRYFLLSMAMNNRIKMFEAYNTESSEGDEVLVFVDGNDEAVKAFCAQVETKHPARSEVSNIVFDDFEGDIMKIGEYSQFCSIVQLNKAIPILLDMRDDLKEMTGDLKELKGDLKAERKNSDAIPQVLEEIKGMREDIQPGYGMHFRQVQSDVRAIKERLGMH
ncbi:MAG: acylphosphatase [Methanothrix sp.]|jgi:acylphosphatase|nr:acylphosphatase [Methanothrix sp.]